VKKIRTLDAALLERVNEEDAQAYVDQYRDTLLKFDGPRCAAWLTWQYRKKLLRGGVIEFKIPKKKTAPTWFFLAMQTLSDRGWHVDQSNDHKYRFWRVRRRPLGEAIPRLRLVKGGTT